MDTFQGLWKTCSLVQGTGPEFEQIEPPPTR
jgi:hypothetical protein